MMEIFTGLLQKIARMQWSDYLDILLMAFCIYKLLPLLLRKSTRRVVVAVGILLTFAFMTSALNLYAVSYVLGQFLKSSFLMMVILFQPELRRTFDRLGSVQFDRLLNMTKPVSEMDIVIYQTVNACESMSRERVGALIVFTRDNRLEEYSRTGTAIDAMVTEQLIRNIFFPKAALHDGAMFIRDGRVAAAGCVLPLSESNRISADLGTRHRAGIGMSELSDAVVVIVSEETGVISVATSGTLKRNLDAQMLEKLLRRELNVENDPQRGTIDRLRRRSGRKDDRNAE